MTAPGVGLDMPGKKTKKKRMEILGSASSTKNPSFSGVMIPYGILCREGRKDTVELFCAIARHSYSRIERLFCLGQDHDQTCKRSTRGETNL